MGICYILLARYDDGVVFYLTDKKYIYDWIKDGDRKIPKQLIEDIMNNEPEMWGITSEKDITDYQKIIKGSDSHREKALVAFKACKDFYSLSELFQYLNQNNLEIGIEVIIDIN